MSDCGSFNSPLHSTMFLLIPDRLPKSVFLCIFTFHNVSINTGKASGLAERYLTLHSTMFLLIRINRLRTKSTICSLHSTMFLLIHDRSAYADKVYTFTFHNVSINTRNTKALHNTQALYIPQCFY